ncbi:uncharacterized protein O3C94_021793 isoform 1-T2 [Discoglossus pictus]
MAMVWWLFLLLAVNIKETLSEKDEQVEENIVGASLGMDVILPCNITPLKVDLDLEVEWIKEESSAMLSFFNEGEEKVESQNVKYRERAGLFKNDIIDGDASLVLKVVEFSDRGLYRCSAHSGSVSVKMLVQLDIKCSVTFSSAVVFISVGSSLAAAVVSFFSMTLWWVRCWFFSSKDQQKHYIRPFKPRRDSTCFIKVCKGNLMGLLLTLIYAVLFALKEFPYPTLLLMLLQALLSITMVFIDSMFRKWFFVYTYLLHSIAILGLTIAVFVEIRETYMEKCIPGAAEWYFSMLIFLYSTCLHCVLVWKTVCVLKDRLQDN